MRAPYKSIEAMLGPPTKARGRAALLLVDLVAPTGSILLMYSLGFFRKGLMQALQQKRTRRPA